MPDEITIITNNVPRPILSSYELTREDYDNYFDYYNVDQIHSGEISPEFFRYKGELYDLGEFSFISHRNDPTAPSEFPGWHGIQPDSFFSGILIRYSPDSDYEEIVVGRYYC